MINVLLLPQLYSATDIKGVSMINFFRDMISLVNNVRNDINWYLGVPETPNYMKWSLEDVAGLERTTMMPILGNGGANFAPMDGFAGVDFPFFGPRSFKVFASEDYLKYDVVLSNFYTAQMVPQMQSLWVIWGTAYKPVCGHPTLVNLYTETGIDKSLPTLATNVGYACVGASIALSDVSMVMTPPDMDEVKRVCRGFLAPSIWRNFDIRIITPILDIEKVPVYKRPKDRCVFFHGGTFEAKRHLFQIVKDLEKISSKHSNVKLLLTTQWAEKKVPDWAMRPFAEWHGDVTRREYREYLKDGDFILCWIDYEGTGLAYTEAIASGMTPIVMKMPWNEGRFPEDYPFYCKTEKDFVAALLVCAKDPGRAKEIGKQAIEHTRKINSRKAIGAYWSDFIDECAEIRHKNTVDRNSWMLKLVKDVLADSRVPDAGWSAKELLAMLIEKSKNLDKSKVKKNWWYVRETLQTLGIVEQEDGRWVKKELN